MFFSVVYLILSPFIMSRYLDDDEISAEEIVVSWKSTLSKRHTEAEVQLIERFRFDLVIKR